MRKTPEPPKGWKDKVPTERPNTDTRLVLDVKDGMTSTHREPISKQGSYPGGMGREEYRRTYPMPGSPAFVNGKWWKRLRRQRAVRSAGARG